ncbi:MAG: hypothetical protein ABH883_02060 [Candidatus Omnitrophota bacterium]
MIIRRVRIFIVAVVVCVVWDHACLHASEGSGTVYQSYGRRDPFVPLIGVHTKGAGEKTLSDVFTVDDISLQGILCDGDGEKKAILNGEIVKAGDQKGLVSIVGISDNAVTVKIDEETYAVKLYK